MVKRTVVLMALVLAGNLAWAKPELGADGRPLPPHLRHKGPQTQKQQPVQMKQQPGLTRMPGRPVDPQRPDFAKKLKAAPRKAGPAQPKPGIKGLVKDDFLVNDDNTGIGYYAGYQYDPKAALLSTGEMMVVWYDASNSWNYQIFGRCYDAAGNPVGDDFLINDFTGNDAYSPSIAACGNSFVVTWYDYRNGHEDIYAQRYGSTGSALGGNFIVNDVASYSYSPSIAANDSGFVIAWCDYRSGNGYDIYAQRYDASGATMGSNFLVNDDVSNFDQYYPSVAISDSGFVVAWDDYRSGSSWEIYAQRYGSTGSPIGGNFLVNDGGSSNAWCPSVAANDSGFMIVWYDYRNGNADIYAQRLDLAGDTLGANFLVNDDGGSYDQYTWGASNVAANDSGFVITWYDYRSGNYYDAYAQRYDAAGLAVGGNFLVNDTSSIYCYYPSIAANENGFAVVWEDTRYNPSGYFDIFCQRYDAAGSALGANFVANNDTGTAEQWDASVAMDRDGRSLAVWYDLRNDDGSCNTVDQYGQLYDADGNPVGTNFIINDTTGAFNRYGYDPKAAFLPGGGFVVTWYGYDFSWDCHIYAQLFDSSGAPVGGNFEVRDISTSYGYGPDVAATDSGFMITWYDNRNSSWDIYAQLFKTDGDTIGGNFRVDDGSSDQYVPRIASNDSGYVITWYDYRNGHSDIYAQLYKANGDTIGGNFLVNDGGNSQYEPSVAMADSGFVITWQDYRYDGSCSDIYAQMYHANGDTIGGNFRVNDDAQGLVDHDCPSVSLSPDGHNMVIAWEDYRNDPNGNVAQIMAQKYVDGVAVDGNVVVNGNTMANRYFWGGKRMACTGQRILFSWDDNRRMKGVDIYARLTDWDLQHIESQPPVISYVDSLDDDIEAPYGPYPVKAVVSDNQAVRSVELLYRINGGTPDTLDMAFAAADTFVISIPEQTVAVDETLTVSYQVIAQDSSLNRTSSIMRSFKVVGPTGVEGQPGAISYSFYLASVSPNPVKGSGEFRFGLANGAQASLGIYNVLGQKVKTLASGPLAAGNHTVKWNGCDDNGRKVSSGVYVCRLTAGENTSIKRFTVIR